MRKAIFILVILSTLVIPSLFATPPTKRRMYVYFTDAMERRGSIYKYVGPRTPIVKLYTRPSGRIYSFLIHWSGSEYKVYYVNANEKKIYVAVHATTGWYENTVYEHKTYVRDIAWGPGRGRTPDLYFSEAWGAARNGKIYRLTSSGIELYYEVKLGDVDGFWAGDFTFAGKTLYLSSGNRVPASIYKVVGDRVVKIFTSRRMSIKGICYVPGPTPTHPGYIYFANFRSEIYCLDLLTRRAILVFSNKSYRWLSDVYVVVRAIP